MKVRSANQIKRSILNVKATLAVEGLRMNRFAVENGTKFLKGQISSKVAIENITNYIQSKNSQ